MFGASAQNQCPDNSARIVDEASCWRAATAVSKLFKGAVSSVDGPSGCYLCEVPYVDELNGVWFNIHPIGGAGGQNLRMLCMTTTAAPTSPGSTYAPTGARSSAACSATSLRCPHAATSALRLG